MPIQTRFWIRVRGDRGCISTIVREREGIPAGSLTTLKPRKKLLNFMVSQLNGPSMINGIRKNGYMIFGMCLPTERI